MQCEFSVMSLHVTSCVDVGITTLLSVSVYQMIISEKLPATSDAVPLLGKSALSSSVSE